MKRADFAGLIDLLDDSLDASWDPPDRRTILDLHRARNEAQHGGILPDPVNLTTWRDAVTVFVGSMILVAYGIDLDDVLLADAIEDPQLRAAMAVIEDRLSAGEFGDALEQTLGLLHVVRVRWRDQQQDAYGWMPLYESPRRDGDLLDAADRATDYADVGVFADDLSEYHWLRALYRHARQGVAVTDSDARRAARFVYHWVLRWQDFDARYERDRWRAAFAAMEPPKTEPPGPPKLLELRFAGRLELAGRPWRRLEVLVANIPDRGRGDWGVDLPAALAVASAQHQLVASENAAHGDVLASTHDAIAGRFAFLFSPAVDAATAKAILDKTFAEAQTRHTRRQVTAEQAAARTQALITGLGPALEDDPLGLFGPPTIAARVERGGDVSVIRLPFHGSDVEVRYAIEIFRGVGGNLAGAGLDAGEITFVVNEDPGPQNDELRTAASRCTNQIQHLRELAIAQDEEDAAFAAELHDE